jgi:hypothetical protein
MSGDLQESGGEGPEPRPALALIGICPASPLTEIMACPLTAPATRRSAMSFPRHLPLEQVLGALGAV